MVIASTILAPSPITMALHVDGCCKYHIGTLTYQDFKVKASCCNATTSRLEENLVKTKGCVKGKHHSKHHTEYYYMNYLRYMNKLVSNLL